MIEDDLREIERRRIAALVAADIAVAAPIHADEYQLVSGGGGVLSKDEYLDPIESGDLRYVQFEAASDIVVRVWHTVAAIRYLAKIDVRFGNDFDRGHFWHTDIYEQRDGRWQVLWSQATPTGDRETSH